MWQAASESERGGQVTRTVISQEERPLSYSEVIQLWQFDDMFGLWFSGLLASTVYKAYRWETPCVTRSTLDRPFEFVLLKCDQLERSVDRRAFASHFRPGKQVVTFSNLGGDAVLVVPCPVGDVSIYGHLGSAIRNAPTDQMVELWREVAIAMENRIGSKPVWLSTAGMGVSWLHVRLDDRPKYYGYAPYKKHD